MKKLYNILFIFNNNDPDNQYKKDIYEGTLKFKAKKYIGKISFCNTEYNEEKIQSNDIVILFIRSGKRFERGDLIKMIQYYTNFETPVFFIFLKNRNRDNLYFRENLPVIKGLQKIYKERVSKDINELIHLVDKYILSMEEPEDDSTISKDDV